MYVNVSVFKVLKMYDFYIFVFKNFKLNWCEMILKCNEWEIFNYIYEVKIKYVLYRLCSFKNLENFF